MSPPRPKPVACEPTAEVNLRIPAAKLAPLLAKGILCAADFRCLDLPSRDAIRRLLLAHCHF